MTPSTSSDSIRNYEPASGKWVSTLGLVISSLAFATTALRVNSQHVKNNTNAAPASNL